MKQCQLCGFKKPLRKSHIIPNFVNRFLKGTSLTGYLRQSGDIHKRVQDGIKVELLCNECELKFSKWESEFAKEIFLPHMNMVGSGQDLIKIVYDSSLISFVISLFWRVTVTTSVTKNISQSNMMFVKNLERIWAEFLNGKRKDWGDCEFHLILLDNIVSQYVADYPTYFNTYILRTWDVGAYDTNEKIGIYIKLPGMLLLCSIIPAKLNGLIETKISNIGTLYIDKQIVKTKFIGLLLLARALVIEREFSKMTPKDFKKISDEISIKLTKLV